MLGQKFLEQKQNLWRGCNIHDKSEWVWYKTPDFLFEVFEGYSGTWKQFKRTSELP